MSKTMDTRVETGSYGTCLNRLGEGNEEAIPFVHGSNPGATARSNCSSSCRPSSSGSTS